MMGMRENNLNGGASKASNPGKRSRVNDRASTDAYQLKAGPTQRCVRFITSRCFWPMRSHSITAPR